MSQHPISQHAKTARQRGEENRDTALAWTLRWGVVSSATLADAIYAKYEVERPGLARQLAKSGWLRPIKVPHGVRLEDGNTVYVLSDAGRLWAETHLDPQLLDLHQRPARPAWSTLQHLLDLQRIALGAHSVVDDFTALTWYSEAETRVLFASEEVVPDLIVDVAAFEETWIELENHAKNDLRLHHWCNRNAQMLETQDTTDRSAGAWGASHVRGIVWVVRTEYQKNRYREFAYMQEGQGTRRDSNTRKIELNAMPVNRAELVKGRIKIMTYDEIIGDEIE